MLGFLCFSVALVAAAFGIVCHCVNGPCPENGTGCDSRDVRFLWGNSKDFESSSNRQGEKVESHHPSPVHGMFIAGRVSNPKLNWNQSTNTKLSSEGYIPLYLPKDEWDHWRSKEGLNKIIMLIISNQQFHTSQV